MADQKLTKAQSDLLQKADRIKENAYSPYSNYKVGAALKAKNGKVYLGCNVENAAYGDTICAERSAICSAISDGCKPGDFETIAVSSNGKNFSPCGSCRQVLNEFGQDIVIVFEFGGEIHVNKLSELLPKR